MLAFLFVSHAFAAPRITAVSRTGNTVHLTIDHGDLIVHRTCHGDLSGAVGALDPDRPADGQFAARVIRFLEMTADQTARVTHDALGRPATFEIPESDGGDLKIHRDEAGQVVRIDVGRSPAWPPRSFTDRRTLDRIVDLLADRAD